MEQQWVFEIPEHIITCTPSNFSWSKYGTGPYHVLITTTDNETVWEYVDFPIETVEWDVTVAPGFPIYFSVNGSSPRDPSTAEPGLTSDCVVHLRSALFTTMATPTSSISSDTISLASTNTSSTTSSTAPPSSTSLEGSVGESFSKLHASTIGFIVLGVVLAILLTVLGRFLRIRYQKKRTSSSSVDLLAEGKTRDTDTANLPDASTPSTGTSQQQVDFREDGNIVMTYADTDGPSTTSDDTAIIQRPKTAYELPASTNRVDESSSLMSSSNPPPMSPVPAAYQSTKWFQAGTSQSFVQSESSATLLEHPAVSLPDHQDRPANPMRETDGGLRLAGGPVRPVSNDILPPAYGEFQ